MSLLKLITFLQSTPAPASLKLTCRRDLSDRPQLANLDPQMKHTTLSTATFSALWFHVVMAISVPTTVI